MVYIKEYVFNPFYSHYLVLLTIVVPRNNNIYSYSPGPPVVLVYGNDDVRSKKWNYFGRYPFDL